MNLISIREYPELRDEAIAYFQQVWPSVRPEIYEDCIVHSVHARQNLPQWYLLKNSEEIVGCAGLITNDFISRMDLYPWICALYIDENHRGHRHASILIDRAKEDAQKAGYDFLYLSTEHVGLYEKYDFTYLGMGYHPWDEQSRIYEIALNHDR